MAELKQHPHADIDDHVRRFHGITAVAELKPLVLSGEGDCDAGFHGITAVAELKPGNGDFLADWTDVVSTASPPWPN